MANNRNDADGNDATNHERFKYGLPSNATGRDKEDYVEYMLQHWEERKKKGSALQDDLWDCFDPYTLEDFQALSQELRESLREHLRRNGIYVPRRRGYSVAKALYEASHDDLEWPEDDWENPKKGTGAPTKPSAPTAPLAPTRTKYSKIKWRDKYQPQH